MNKTFEKIFLLLAGAALTLLFVKQCNTKTETPPIIKVVPADSVPYIVYKDKPKPYAIHYRDSVPYYDTVWLPGDTSFVLVPIDTSALMKDCLAKVVYRDTLKNDSSAFILLNEMVSKNRVQYREVFFQNRRATAYIEERTKAFVLGVGGNISGLDFSAGYRSKRDIFSVSYSGLGLGLRYQREIGWKSRSEK